MEEVTAGGAEFTKCFVVMYSILIYGRATVPQRGEVGEVQVSGGGVTALVMGNVLRERVTSFGDGARETDFGDD